MATSLQAAPTAAFDLRPFDADDTAFMFKTWLRSYRYAPPSRGIGNDDFYTGHHAVIERILDRPSTRIVVACLPESPTVILGYAVADGNVLHYVLTKENFRRFGVGSALLSALEFDGPPRLSHVTADWTHAFSRRYPASRWNPYLLG